MLEASTSSEIVLTGTTDGRFSFPRFQASFDGMFAIAKLMELSAICGMPFSQGLASVPVRAYQEICLPCAWEMKGGIMRKMSEDSLEKDATFIDGIKVQSGENWVLILPDQYLPCVHIVADAKDHKTAQALMTEYQNKIVMWKKELV
jgi:mannose-1-phosphate guanylyltransferase/phosphomannomutase